MLGEAGGTELGWDAKERRIRIPRLERWLGLVERKAM